MVVSLCLSNSQFVVFLSFSTPTHTQSKIRELEDKLGEERHHRKLIVEKTAEVIKLENQGLLCKGFYLLIC